MESLQLEYQSPDEPSDQPALKRRKIEASGPSGLTVLSDLIYQIVQPSAIATGDFEEIIVYVLLLHHLPYLP